MTALRCLLVPLPSTEIGGTEIQTLVVLRAVAALGVRVALAAEPALLPALALRLVGMPLIQLHPASGLGWRPAAFHRSPEAQQQAVAPLIAALRPEAAMLPLPWPSAGIGPARALAAAALPSLSIGHLVPPDGDAAAIHALGGWPAPPGVVAAVSPPAALLLATGFGLPPQAVAVLPNGVHVPAEDPAARAAARLAKRALLGLPAQARLLLFVGNISQRKGAEMLPALARALPPGTTLVALGAGPLRQALAAEASPLRLQGEVTDVGAWMLAADALVLPSRLEGAPLVLLEAAARRLPILASLEAAASLGAAAPGLVTLVRNENAAVLTQDVLQYLVGVMAQNMTEHAWAHAQAQSQEHMLGRYLARLRQLLA